ncbi:MAG: septum formation family protein [Nocardioides sp.]
MALLASVVVTAGTMTVLLLRQDVPADEPATGPPPAAAPSPSGKPATAAPRPEADSCYRLAYDDALAPTSRNKPVPCTGKVTARTFYVGSLDTVVDGHLLAVDSARVRRQLATDCPRRFTTYVGGNERARRLSMLSTVWFSPSVGQSDAGQSWYRCDVIGVESEGRLATLKGSLKGVLDSDAGLARYGICGTAEPGAPGFKRVICGSRHSWEAVEVVNVPGNAYPTGAPASVEDTCMDRARSRAEDALNFEWGFELPTREQWKSGRRYALCWAPS